MSLTHFQSANLPHGGLFLPPRAGRQVMELAFFSLPPLQKVRFPDFW